MEDKMVIEQIKQLCHDRNWSYYKLAKKSNIPYSSLNSLLKHKHIPTINTLICVCNGFGIRLSDFFKSIENNSSLSDPISNLLRIWSLLDESSQELALTYMYGLAHEKLERIKR